VTRSVTALLPTSPSSTTTSPSSCSWISGVGSASYPSSQLPAAFDKSFEEWKPEVDSSLSAVKFELSKLKTFFDRDAKSSSTPRPGVLPISSTTVQLAIGTRSDGPNGHCVKSSHQGCGFGHVYTQTHDLVIGTVLPSPPNPPYQHHPLFVPNSDPHSPHTVIVMGLK
jgi:hypothetical protein